MKSRLLILFTSTALLVAAQAEDRSTWLSAAVDAKGVRHRGSEYVGKAPWMNDAVHMVQPEYPQSERVLKHQGSALLRLTLELKTGSVVQVAILESTGYSVLDNSALVAFRQWRWRPGKWKQIDVAMTFTFGRQAGMSIGPPSRR